MLSDADKLAEEFYAYFQKIGTWRIPIKCLMSEPVNSRMIAFQQGSMQDEYMRWTDQPLSF